MRVLLPFLIQLIKIVVLVTNIKSFCYVTRVLIIIINRLTIITRVPRAVTGVLKPVTRDFRRLPNMFQTVMVKLKSREGRGVNSPAIHRGAKRRKFQSPARDERIFNESSFVPHGTRTRKSSANPAINRGAIFNCSYGAKKQALFLDHYQNIYSHLLLTYIRNCEGFVKSQHLQLVSGKNKI